MQSREEKSDHVNTDRRSFSPGFALRQEGTNELSDPLPEIRLIYIIEFYMRIIRRKRYDADKMVYYRQRGDSVWTEGLCAGMTGRGYLKKM